MDKAQPSNLRTDSVDTVTNAVSSAATNSADRLGLEDIVHLANKVGLEYVAARKEAERLELLKNTIRARISIRLDDGSQSEAKLKRLMETDPEYEDFILKLVTARAEAEKLRVRYESYKNLFDARRSLLSYQKAEMKLL
jgi:hypothetical protein